MRTKTIESPSYNNLISELNRRISRLESILNGAPIADAKIASIKWNKAQGGTATLGGADNGNGVLDVKDESGSSVVTIDKNGIQVNDGKIIINDDSGTSVIDGKGLVSTAAFTSDGKANIGLNQNFTVQDVYTYVTGSQINFILERDTNILILANATGLMSSTTGNGVVAIYLDDQELPTTRMWFDSNTHMVTAETHYMVMPASAGSHSVKLMGKLGVYSETPYFHLSSYALSYLQLGK